MSHLFLAFLRRSSLRLFALVILSGFSAACTNVPSSDVGSGSLYAELTATSTDGVSSLVKGILKVGGATSSTFVDLVGDDVLSTTAAGQKKRLGRRESAGAVWYEVSFPQGAAETVFTIDFERSKDDGALGSEATLPAPFVISEPAEQQAFSRQNDAVTVRWSPSGTTDTIKWLASGPCILPAWGTVAGDPGVLVVEAGHLKPLDGSNGAVCPVGIQVSRVRPGTLSRGYGKGGTIEGRQERTVQIRSEP